MPTLTIIGGGQVGKALGYALTQQAGFTLNGVLNRSLTSAQQACDFIGQGKAVQHYAELTTADVYLITVTDSHISHCAESLAASGVLQPGNLVIHCSGALTVAALDAAQMKGADVASLHPIKSFIDPALSVATLNDTFFGLEANAEITAKITPWITAIGGHVLPIATEQKSFYHIALVIACNYLTALTEVAVQCLGKAGLSAEQSLAALKPLMSYTLENIFHHGTAAALSGPIARGDSKIVATHLHALQQNAPDIVTLYKALGKVALELASAKGSLSTQGIADLKEALV